jgi:hypothetical protein
MFAYRSGTHFGGKLTVAAAANRQVLRGLLMPKPIGRARSSGFRLDSRRPPSSWTSVASARLRPSIPADRDAAESIESREHAPNLLAGTNSGVHGPAIRSPARGQYAEAGPVRPLKAAAPDSIRHRFEIDHEGIDQAALQQSASSLSPLLFTCLLWNLAA